MTSQTHTHTGYGIGFAESGKVRDSIDAARAPQGRTE